MQGERLWKLVFIAAVLFVACAKTVAAADGVSLERVRSLLDAGEAETAYQQLSRSGAIFDADPSYRFLLGLAALGSGRTAAAVEALSVQLERYPDDTAARALYGRALYLDGQPDAAAAAFREALTDDALPPATRRTITRYLAILEGPGLSPGRTRWAASMSVGGGFDTNANRATSDGTVAVPVFSNLPFRLAAGARETSSALVDLQLDGGVGHWLTERWRVHARGALRRVDYLAGRARRFDQDTYTLGGGVSYAFGRHQVTAEIDARWFTVDNDLFRRSGGGSLGWRMAVDRRLQVNAFFSGSDVGYHPRARQSVRDVTRWLGGAGLTRVFGAKHNLLIELGAWGGLEDDHDPFGEHLGRTLYGGRIAPRWILSDRLTLSTDFLVESSDYSDTEPLFLRSRDDTFYRLAAAARWRIAGAWSLEPALEYQRNRSDIPTSDYDALVARMHVRYDFH